MPEWSRRHQPQEYESDRNWSCHQNTPCGSSSRHRLHAPHRGSFHRLRDASSCPEDRDRSHGQTWSPPATTDRGTGFDRRWSREYSTPTHRQLLRPHPFRIDSSASVLERLTYPQHRQKELPLLVPTRYACAAFLVRLGEVIECSDMTDTKMGLTS